MRFSDIFLSAGVLLIVAMMILPLPAEILDVLLAVNIAGALIILLVSIYANEPLKFSVFPSILLLATLFRLGLNILSTRLILLNAEAGEIIATFGDFVVGGNYVVGVVVFLILVVIQFVVITNGAGRVAEVTARFTLDAMPGKQVAIDADLNAGVIDDQEARRRRKEIQAEADFYGAMDGASKFVKGDAIAGIIIIIINITAGFVIGVVQLGIEPAEALRTFTLLTIGDGLVSQIPALIISTATGIIVTRAATDSDLGQQVVSQILAQPRVLGVVAVALVLLGIVPGMPKLTFFVLAALFGGIAYMVHSGSRQADAEAADGESATPAEPESLNHLLAIDPMELEIGFGLVPLVDLDQGGNLLSRITLVRRQIVVDLGLLMPTIRIRDNMQLDANEYRIKLRSVTVARGEVRPDRLLAMNPGLVEEEIDGIETTEPAFGLPALWIGQDKRERAELVGYTVVDPASVVATHLTETVRNFAAAILTRQDVSNLLDNLKEDYPAVVDELVPNQLTLGDVQRVLQGLLREQISIRDLLTVLETLANYAKLTTDPDVLTEFVRQSLARAICAQYADERGTVSVLTIDAGLQEQLMGSLEQTDQGLTLALDPDMGQKLAQALAQEMEKMASQGYTPVLLAPTQLRLALRRYIETILPKLVVLSFGEIAPQFQAQTRGTVTL